MPQAADENVTPTQSRGITRAGHLSTFQCCADSTLQTPSPRPMRILARPSSLRITFIFASNVSAPHPRHRSISGVVPPVAGDPRLTQYAERNGRKTLTTVQGLPKKFDQKKILKVIKKKFACNGTIVNDTEMGEVIQLQGDQRKDVQEFLVDKKEGLGLDSKDIKVRLHKSPPATFEPPADCYRSTVSKRRNLMSRPPSVRWFWLLYGEHKSHATDMGQ